MSATIEKQLGETLRDAQLALYLSAIVPDDETLNSLGLADHIKTANDLYHYWLLDVLVSQDVPTSPVACATASLQQYINSILANMEPGYHTASIPKDQIETWRTVMHQYPTWAANQRLHYFPAFYLDPTLRETSTESFRQLENDINQNQLTSDLAQTATLAYLAKFEEVANLKTLNGYIDDLDFANSTYYFIAKSRTASTYYWRSLNMAMRPFTGAAKSTETSALPKYDAPEPQAWSDWKRANLPISDSAIEHTIRPVIFNNRLYVIWAECVFQDRHTVSQTDNNSTKTNPLFRLNLCYKKYDDSWSTPQTCLQGFGTHDSFHMLDLDEIRRHTQTVAVHDPKHSPPSLHIALYVKSDEPIENLTCPFWISAHIDKDATTSSVLFPDGVFTDLTESAFHEDDIPSTRPDAKKGRGSHKRKAAPKPTDLSMIKHALSTTENGVLQFPNSSGTLKAPCITIRQDNVSGTVEFIDFSTSSISASDIHTGSQSSSPRRSIRMNITFARHLIERAESGMETLLSWGSQQMQEPAFVENAPTEKMDFYGAYGRYFIELFLYLPWLMAHRFCLERQYGEAERWLHYLFNPGRKKIKDQNPDYWNAVPLTSIETHGQLTYAIQSPQDPHQIALSHPVHFRKALFMLYIDILLNRGDTAYRTLTPDGLAQAKLWYIRALDLLGPRPDLKQTDLWTTVTLKAFCEERNTVLRTFENKLGKEGKHKPEAGSPGVAPQVCERPYASPPSVHTIDTPHLHLPFNPVLIARWEKLESRLHNLRHHLDMAGKPLRLPLFTAPANPGDLSGSTPRRAAEPGIYQRQGTEIPPYRFSVLHAHAMSAVDTVIQFGATLLSFIERSEQASYQEIQQHHLWDMANIAVDLQTQVLKADQKNKETLLASKAVVEGRVDYYNQLVNEVINPAEAAAAALHLTGRVAEASAHAAQAVAQGLKVVPNIFGLADGGHRIEGLPLAVMAGAQGAAAAAHGAGEALERAAQYRRRHEEWTFMRDQARLEIAQLDAQLALETERETASLLVLRQTRTALEQARTVYSLLSHRFTNSQLYQWFTGQMSGFYYQAYDAALSLCQFTELCWRYEMADHSTPAFVQPQAWNSTYRGLGPGERMKLALLNMQNAYLLGNERELEIHKTVSLRQLKDKDKNSSINKNWRDTPGSSENSTVKGFRSDLKTGSCEFELTQAMLDNDYPGHYLRRIKSISITLPTTLGPYDDIRALLIQTRSEVVMPGDSAPSIKSLLANRQVALSTGLDDNGLFTLSAQDERYQPFEYTGAISRWKLVFPNPAAQKAMLESLSDVIVHLKYTARADGGAL